ncbi:MAG: hypothetical protein MI749_15650 [Desulfovibrionales bacterium]|nr:hypothetical protein [Desulfovibrionales bacterium]
MMSMKGLVTDWCCAGGAMVFSVELNLVLRLLGFLDAIAVPGFVSYLYKSRQVKAIQVLEILALKQDVHFLENTKFSLSIY